MRRRLLWCALLLFAPLAAPTPAAPAPSPEAARAILDTVSARYTRLSSFRIAGVTHAHVQGGPMSENTVDIPFLWAARRPSRLHNEMRNPYMTSIWIADGDSLWLWAPSLQQYQVTAAPSLVAGATPDPAARQLDPLLMWKMAAQGVTRVTPLGRDTVLTDAGSIECTKLELEYPADSTRPEIKMRPRVLWIDEAHGTVLLDSVTVDMHHPQMGDLTSVQTTRVVDFDLSGAPDSLFRFQPPPGAERVDQIGARPPEASPLTGKPAPGFSLADLEGRTVSLARLRGKVVVLDFWATWCGPCRRWLPIVAKVAKAASTRGVRTYAVNVRETKSQVRSYLRENGLTIPVLFDHSGGTGDAYGASSIPLTVIVGRDGKVVKTLLGLHQEDDLRAALKQAGIAGL